VILDAIERAMMNDAFRTGLQHLYEARESYDAVFDFAILHHVPDWRGALREIHRVLKPGGRAYLEEVLAAFITHPLWKALLDHPQDDRFDADGFEGALRAIGFTNVRRRTLARSFAWFVAEKPVEAA
jgi:SAM-dependent methyltransferase